MIRLKDNSDVTENKDSCIIQELLNRDLADLERDDFIIFPPDIASSEDLERDNYIFKQHNGQVRTQNIAAVLKKGEEEVRIHSRFYDTDAMSEDFFLVYLLQKVLNLNIVRSAVNRNSDDFYYDLLVYLFPMYLDNAMQKGMYKEYVKRQYNNANVKGSIHIARHIKVNTPFMGRIAYDTREFSYDNRLTQLIRHTIEKLELDYAFDFHSKEETRENIRAVIQATPAYSRMERFDVLEENTLNPIRHGYFEEYYLLQKLCIQILNEERIGYGSEDDEVHGILIDIAWLWEEYLNTLLHRQFIHPENKKGYGAVPLFSSRERPEAYPDFYSKDRKIVLDAKYKLLDSNEKGIVREDRYQIISYLHILKSEMAGVIYPSKQSTKYIHVGELNGFGGSLCKIAIKIPQKIHSYERFEELMGESESEFMSALLEHGIGLQGGRLN